jgi:hypothetical protein
MAQRSGGWARCRFDEPHRGVRLGHHDKVGAGDPLRATVRTPCHGQLGVASDGAILLRDQAPGWDGVPRGVRDGSPNALRSMGRRLAASTRLRSPERPLSRSGDANYAAGWQASGARETALVLAPRSVPPRSSPGGPCRLHAKSIVNGSRNVIEERHGVSSRPDLTKSAASPGRGPAICRPWWRGGQAARR